MAKVSGALQVHHRSAAGSFYSISQAAELLGVSRVSIWRWIRDGHLPVVRLGHRTTRIAGEDLQRLPTRLGSAGQRSRAVQRMAAAASDADSDGSTDGASRHFVQFYESDVFLLEAVRDFVGPALRAGDTAVVVATNEHLEYVEELFFAEGLDLPSARAAGQYVPLDAEQTLATFMVDRMPDPVRFEATLEPLIAPATASGRRVRIYGEMVALLSGEGNYAATIRLEQLWNDLQHKHSFSLFCGYPMDHFGGEPLGELLTDVCSEHAYVIPSEGYTSLGNEYDRLRAVALLQQQAKSLQAEIAERKRVEERLRVALLAERVAREAAEAAVRSRDEFLAIASHELKTPITALSGHAQLALRRLARTGELEPERVARTLHTITGQADKLSRLIGQLLDISRLEAGKLILEPERTDVVELVEQVVCNAREWSDLHSISFDGPTALEVVCDPLRLEQVVTNLIDNAIKYSPDGGAIDVTLSPSLDCVNLAVRDRGLGIPPEKRDQIFERFYQAHAAGYRSGMGLGLHISREIVELHGGHIRAEFPNDGGTRFIVQLPSEFLRSPTL